MKIDYRFIGENFWVLSPVLLILLIVLWLWIGPLLFGSHTDRIYDRRSPIESPNVSTPTDPLRSPPTGS